ncbi:MAG: hypothetical protein Q8L51_02115 [Candidatus Amesbacteria bacterium]|nr:hypothetical protein [Candidatus Amesbacteria bacterium]
MNPSNSSWLQKLGIELKKYNDNLTISYFRLRLTMMARCCEVHSEVTESGYGTWTVGNLKVKVIQRISVKDLPAQCAIDSAIARVKSQSLTGGISPCKCGLQISWDPIIIPVDEVK